MGVGLLLAAAFATAPAGAVPLVFPDTLRARAGPVRLGEISDLSALPAPLRARAAAVVVLAMAPPASHHSHAALAARARALLPALGPWLPRSYPGRLSVPPATPGIAAVALATTEAVAAGDAVTLRVRTGPFEIRREARALQPAKPGQAVFVRTADGVVRATCCGASQ